MSPIFSLNNNNNNNNFGTEIWFFVWYILFTVTDKIFDVREVDIYISPIRKKIKCISLQANDLFHLCILITFIVCVCVCGTSRIIKKFI